MICTKCGAQNVEGIQFCGFCGARLDPQQSFYNNQSQNQQQNYGMYPPKNYMTEAIIVTIVSFLCCCSLISMVLGIIAIIKADSVNTEFNRGNYHKAQSNAATAKTLTLWAAIIFVLFKVIWFITYFTGYASWFNNFGRFQNYFNM